jgi:hypothetical protein
MHGSFVAAALGAAALSFLASPHAAIDLAQSNAAATPQAAVVCDVVLGLIAPIDPDGSGASSRYSVALYAADADTATASGTIALYTAGDRYDVPFANATALSPGSHATRKPLVVEFSEPVRIERGNVVSTTGPSGGTCVPFTAWNPPQYAGDAPDAQRVDANADNARLLQAPAGVPISAQRCAGPNAPPTMVQPSHITGPGYAWSRDLNADVAIAIDDDGSVAGATIYRSSGVAAYDLIVLAQARESTYAPGVLRCRATGGIYLFHGTLKGG